MPLPATVTAKMTLAMLEKQGFRCAISGRKLTPESASLDHIVPLARGGEHDLSNVWIVDHVVNTAKGTLTVEEFVAMCRDITNHHAANAQPVAA